MISQHSTAHDIAVQSSPVQSTQIEPSPEEASRPEQRRDPPGPSEQARAVSTGGRGGGGDARVEHHEGGESHLHEASEEDQLLDVM
jgi:hypothetical protein